jgi:RNA recognition motif-containing protein
MTEAKKLGTRLRTQRIFLPVDERSATAQAGCLFGVSEMKKLFVGSLSWNTSDQELENAFSAFGEVTEAKVITDRNTGRSRGFGFVSFEQDEAADKALQEMNNTELDGRTITVNVAHDKRRDSRPRGGGGGGYGGGGGGGGGRW